VKHDLDIVRPCPNGCPRCLQRYDYTQVVPEPKSDAISSARHFTCSLCEHTHFADFALRPDLGESHLLKVVHQREDDAPRASRTLVGVAPPARGSSEPPSRGSYLHRGEVRS
jgi:hypothetical protein